MEKLCYEAIDDGIFFGILQLACSWSSGLLFLVINSFFFGQIRKDSLSSLTLGVPAGCAFFNPFLVVESHRGKLSVEECEKDTL